MGKIKGRHRIRFKMTIWIAALVLLSVVVTAGISYFQSYDMIWNQLTTEALRVAEIVSKDMDVEAVEKLQTEEDMNSDTFQNLGAYLRHTMEMTGVKYMYLMRMEGDDLVYIIEGEDYDSDEPTSIGDVEEEVYEGYLTAFEGTINRDEEITIDDDGALLSAYAPIKKDGEVIAIVGVDYDATAANQALTDFKNIVLILVIATILLAAVLAFVMAEMLSRGIVKLSRSSEAIAGGDFRINPVDYNLDSLNL